MINWLMKFQRPWALITNNSMFFVKLPHHFEGNHSDLKDKPPYFLNMKNNEVYASKTNATPVLETKNAKVLAA